MPSTAYFFNPNTGSEGLAELSKVAVEQEGDASLITGSDAHRYNQSYPFLSQRVPKFKLPLKHRTELCQRTKPFELTLAEIGQFGKAVLYVKAHAPELFTLHHNLLDIYQPPLSEQVNYFEGAAFIPHLTLAHVESGLTEADIAQMALVASVAWLQPVRFVASTLDIYCSQQEGNGYHLQEEIPLSG